MSQTLHTFPRSIFFPAPALSLYSTGRGAFQYASGTEHKHDKDWDNRQSDSDIHSSIIILIYSLHLLHQNGQCEFVLGEQRMDGFTKAFQDSTKVKMAWVATPGIMIGK